LAETELLAAYWMLAGLRPTAAAIPSIHPLPDRAAAAAAAGYRGIGLSHADLMHNVALHGHAGIKTILADHGIVHLELEALMGWHGPPETRRESGIIWRDMLVAAERIGVRQIKATGDFTDTATAPEAMAAPFATLARQARDAGTRVALEIVAFSNVRDVPSALAVLGDSATQGGGLMLDCWHFARNNLPLASLAALDGGMIAGVEVSDMAETVVGSLFEDTVDHRRLCGAGVYDVPAFLAAVAATGYRGPVGAEVLSARLRAAPLDETAAASFNATLDAIHHSR
jgi:sugar phosphate isomerase/epimerase